MGSPLFDPAPALPTGGTIVPRPYQTEGIAAARRIVGEGCKRLLLVMATGGGKTIVAALIGHGAVAKGKRLLFVAHRREIVAQSFWKLVEAGIPEADCGVVMADGAILHPVTRAVYKAKRPTAPVQVCSIQTLQHWPAERLPPADVVFIDEAHHAKAKTWKRILDHYQARGAVVIGLTATPVRGDGKGLADLFDRLHVIAGFPELVAGGFLVAPRAFASTPPDLSKVRTLGKRGDYVEADLEAACDTKILVGRIVEHWQKLADGRTTVVFATGVAHSRHITAEFRAAGVAAEHLDGATPRDDRDAILGRLADGTTRVVCNCNVLTEGWDLPRTKCIVLARPTKSEGLFLQMAGRGLRPWQDTSAILLDHAGCCHAYGLPQDPREWVLEEDRAKQPRVGPPPHKTCPSCGALCGTATRVCPECGHEFEGQQVTVVEGDLVEVTSHRAAPAPERRTWYAAELRRAADRGYKIGYARHRYRERFGDWPRFYDLEREAFVTTSPPPEAPAPSRVPGPATAARGPASSRRTCDRCAAFTCTGCPLAQAVAHG